MPTSASPNSTKPRSSRRLTIALARNSICLIVPIQLRLAAPILKHDFRPECAGCVGVPGLVRRDRHNATGVNRAGASIVTKDVDRPILDGGQQGDRLRQRSIDLATVNRAKMEPGTNRPRAVARTKPVRGLRLRHAASLDGPCLAVMRC